MRVVIRRGASCVLAAGLALTAPAALAITFDVGDVSGTLNTTMTAGAGWRMKDRSVNLVGKGNLNPAVCGGEAQSCQGLFKGQIHPAQTLVAAPGTAFLNGDDGNWNYDKGDLTQAVFKVTQDIKLTWGDYGFFGKWLYFYDFINNDFDEFHPNWVTSANQGITGCPGGSGCTNTNSSFPQTYGPGLPTSRKRTDGETLRQIGTDLQLFDYYVYGNFTMPFTEDKSVTFKLGNQTLNWGESTVLVINSLNQVNPLNVNNFTRVGFDLSELFTPTGLLFLSTEVYEGVTVEGYYGYNWKPLEIPAYGSFFSFADLGSYGAHDWGSISFGGPAEDPDYCFQANGDRGTGDTSNPAANVYSNPNSGCGTPLNNPLSGLTATSTTIRRLADNEPSSQGQFGIAFKYFAEWLNNGTELGFYFMNYHSKLPYVSLYSTVASCARAEGNANNAETTNFATLINNCPDLPLVHAGDTDGVRGATSNAVPIDTVKYQVEYPENIQLYGLSFNTTVGDISLQGELSLRPNLPVQIDLQDLTFLALQPMLTRCHDPTPATPCEGTNAGSSPVDGNTYQTSDFVPYPGTGITAYEDTFDLLIGSGAGSARSFPSFIGAYRGIPAGEMAPNTYIPGYERFNVWQMDLGATYIQGATDNSIGADQLIWLFEWGVQYVPGLPGTDELQVETPGTYYHASAGADGTGTNNYKQDCANTIDCTWGGYNPAIPGPAGFYGGCTQAMLDDNSLNTNCGDGLRFNPHQQPADTFANNQNWSTGVALVNLTRYESVFPGISFAPITIFQWGVKGNSVDVANQFTEGKKQIIFNFETRYKESLSFYVGHVWFTGGGDANLQADRNELFSYVKYLF